MTDILHHVKYENGMKRKILLEHGHSMSQHEPGPIHILI